jgi:hypothetical protein
MMMKGTVTVVVAVAVAAAAVTVTINDGEPMNRRLGVVFIILII